MKLVVFAHTPPPHHGQSYMVQLMLEGFGGDQRQGTRATRAGTDRGIECYHVNARLSKRLEDIGDLRIGKFFLLLGYSVQAIWCRFRYGAENLYYIPAPGKRSALYRDWLVMLLCRPFFKRVILHWHAAGLAKWLETVIQMRGRSFTYRLMKKVDLSIVLSRYNRADAEKLFSQQIRVISNGIPDPCPAFATEVLPRRRARFAARKKLIEGRALTETDVAQAGGDPRTVRVLYLAHCTHEKGLFDAVEGAQRANRLLKASSSPITLRLQVAGTFVNEEEKVRFDALMSQPGSEHIEYLGFVSGERKTQLLRDADIFCFPTYYQNENQPVNLIEAMALGLPILTTRWRSIPELFPENYAGLVPARAPEAVAQALLDLMGKESGEGFRQNFIASYTLERHLTALAEALQSVTAATAPAKPLPVSATR